MKKILILILTLLIVAGSGLIWFQVKSQTQPEKKGQIYTSPAEGITYDRDICYQNTEQNNCYMDIGYQKTGEAKPLVVLVHGGSWIKGSRSELEILSYTFSARGYVTANIDYDLIKLEEASVGKYTIKTEEQCVEAALDYLIAHAQEFEIDTENIYLVGHSAGGQLAGHVAETTEKPLKGLIIIAGATNLRSVVYETSETTQETMMVLLPFIFDGVVESDIITEMTKVDVASNIYPEMPKTLLIHGDYDETISYMMSQDLYDSMINIGCDVELEIIHEMGHSISAGKICDLMIDFMK